MDPNLLLGLAKVAGGLFGPKPPTPRQNLLSQAQGAREAAEKYGFNPLTMLQYGQTAGASGAGSLASLDLMIDGAADIADVVSGDSERRRKAQELELDLAKIKIEQARSGVYVAAPPGATTGEFSPERFTAAQPTRAKLPTLGDMRDPNWLTPDRSTVAKPTENIGLVMEIENEALDAVNGGKPLIVPGADGEVLDLGQLATIGLVGFPQMLANSYAAGANRPRELAAKYPDMYDRMKKEAEEKSAAKWAAMPETDAPFWARPRFAWE